MRINTNVSAIIANAHLATNQDKLSLSLERLSSGYKINHSKDNPAGLAISQKMRSQLNGLDQSDNNVQDGISLLQTAEGAISEVQSMLTRMKELAVQAANDVNSESEREAIQQEIDNLCKEIDRISNETDFNTKSLLNGDLQRKVYSNIEGVKQVQVTDGFADGIYGITITQDAKQANVSGNMPTGNITADQAGEITINGVKIALNEGDTPAVVQSKIIAGAEKSGGYAVVTGGTVNLYTNEFGSNEVLEVNFSNDGIKNLFGFSGAGTQTLSDGTIIATGDDAKAEFTMAGGKRVGFEDTASISAYGNTVTVRDINDRTFVMEVPKDASTKNGGKIEQTVTDIGTFRVHVGANENQLIKVNLSEVSVSSLGLSNINVYSHRNASKAIAKVDNAVSKLATLRSELGAYQNRLDHTDNNIGVSSENLTAAYSRIMDCDMAEEMTEYTQANVLAQAGTSMLSQANARPETVLQLLQR